MTVIKKLELIHFGKFKDTVIDLNCGKNCFQEANEWGKSTITDFIIYMLYGFKKTTKKGITVEQNLLKKYLPWNDDSHIFGALELERDGKLIRIERKTLASGRTALNVRDAGGNTLDILEPGTEFFGVDCETFMRTFLVRQTDIVFDGTGDIETALKNLVTTGDEQTSFDAALKIIIDKKNKFQHGDRRSGRVFDLPKLITEKKLERSGLLTKKDNLLISLNEYNDLKEKLAAVEKTEKELASKKDACIGNDAKKTVARAEQIIAECEDYAKKVTEGECVVAENDVKTATEIFNNREIVKSIYENAKAQLQNAKAEFERSKEQLIGIEYVAENKAEIESHLAKKPKINLPLIVTGLGVTVMAVAFWPLAILGAVVILLGLLIKIKPKPILDKTNEQLSADLEKYKAVKADIESKEKSFNNEMAEFDKQKLAFEVADDEVEKCKEKYNITEPSELSTLLAQSKNADMVRSHMERLERELNALLQDKTLDDYKELAKNADGSDLGILELNRLSRQAAQQKSELVLALSQLEKSRIECDAVLEKINDLSVNIKALETELSDAEYQNGVLTIARDVLTEAYDKINSVYSPIISKKISPYLDALTGGKYTEAILDRQFNIRVKYKGEYKELGFFSRGTADCVYLSVRLAMAEILEGESTLPLILDDPFWSFDKDRLSFANNLINTIAKNRQIVVFCAK